MAADAASAGREEPRVAVTATHRRAQRRRAPPRRHSNPRVTTTRDHAENSFEVDRDEGHWTPDPLLDASMGANRAARAAGYTPNPSPIAIATPMDPAIAHHSRVMWFETNWGTMIAPSTPTPAPRIPAGQPQGGRFDEELSTYRPRASRRALFADRSRAPVR